MGGIAWNGCVKMFGGSRWCELGFRKFGSGAQPVLYAGGLVAFWKISVVFWFSWSQADRQGRKLLESLQQRVREGGLLCEMTRDQTYDQTVNQTNQTFQSRQSNSWWAREQKKPACLHSRHGICTNGLPVFVFEHGQPDQVLEYVEVI